MMNKMRTSIMATLGIGAAIYGLSRYQNGRYLRPIKDFMQNFNLNNSQANMITQPIMEISKELAPKNLANMNNKQQTNNQG